jgi:hypothetical protein
VTVVRPRAEPIRDESPFIAHHLATGNLVPRLAEQLLDEIAALIGSLACGPFVRTRQDGHPRHGRMVELSVLSADW